MEEGKERDREQLEALNGSRSAVVEPLVRFAQRVAEADGEEMALAVYRLLEDVQAAEHLKELAARLAADGRPELAERQLRLWDVLMAILDQSALVLKGCRLRHTRYAELLRLVILANDIASIPEGLDEVTVGAADRIRAEEPKVVFLLGAAQGDFPRPGRRASQSAPLRLSRRHCPFCRGSLFTPRTACRRLGRQTPRSPPLRWPHSNGSGIRRFPQR